MVIYDEEELRRQSREYAARETFTFLHRRLVTITVTIPVVTALLLIATRDLYPGISVTVRVAVGVIVATLSGIAYWTGRRFLARRTRAVVPFKSY